VATPLRAFVDDRKHPQNDNKHANIKGRIGLYFGDTCMVNGDEKRIDCIKILLGHMN